ncbi:autotransporter domain-containing protein [Pontiellaceae bacterium B12219]|nr:autotransporter domain-containing protein [Pontiellaceae bacterium B12219]
MTRFLKILTVALGFGAVASAQTYTNILDEVGGTNQYVTTAWNTTNSIIIGNSTSSNTLVIADSGRVTNSTSVIGAGTNANDNAAYVTDGAVWTMSGDMTVGDQGGANYLDVRSGGSISNANAFVGAGETASNNVVAVYGDDSRWDNAGTLTVGGVSNGVYVYNGGTISAADLVISTNGSSFNLGYDGTFELDNSLDVSSEGFNWIEGGHLKLTGDLSGMTTTNGGAELTGERILTLNGGDWDVASESLTVSNATLTATNGSWVVVGEATSNEVGAVNSGIRVGSTNDASLLVQDSAYVETDGTLYLGGTATNITGSATVTNGSTIKVAGLQINNDGSAFNLEDGGKLQVTGAFNAGTQTNLNWNSGGELEVNGALTLDGGLTDEGRILTVSGSNANWTAANSVVSGTNSVVTISDGADLVSTNGMVSGATNSVAITGSGSTWKNDGVLTITGSTNVVSVSSGGKVTTGSLDVDASNRFDLNSGGTLAITTNFNFGATSNLNWKNGGNLSVEGTLEGMDTAEVVFDGTTKTSAILNGGRKLSLDGGSWNNGTNNLIVGYNSSYASMAVTNGAKVTNSDGYIGWGSSAAFNSVLVAGTNSLWSNTGGDLMVGAYWNGTTLAGTGIGNSLTVSNNAQVFVGEATTNVPGMLVASTNKANLTVWNGTVTVEDTLYLGQDTNTTGSATIKSGGTLSVGDLVIADTNSALNLTSGGVFDIRNDFDVAAWETNGFNWGSNATLSVGGTLTGMTNVLSKGQKLNLDGSDATWTINGEDLKIGLDDSSVLSLLNGATLTNLNSDTYIGANTNTGSHGVVMKEDSYWQADGDLFVGDSTSENYLQILSGSTNELTGSAQIGGINTEDNYVRIEGTNSFWDVGGNVTVGGASNSVGNALLVYDAAKVSITNSLTVNSGNEMAVGEGAEVAVGGDITIHTNTTVAGSGTLLLTDGTAALRLMEGNANIDTSLRIQGQGSNTVDVDGGAFYLVGTNSNQYAGFQTLELEDADFIGLGTNDAFSVVRMTNGTIRPTGLGTSQLGTMVIQGDFKSSNTVYQAQVYSTGNDLLHFMGNSVDLTGLVAKVTVEQAPTNLTATILKSDGGLTNNFESTTIVNKLLLYDAELVQNGNDMNVVITTNTTQFSSSLDFAATESIRSGFSAMKDGVFTRTKQLRRNMVATSHAIPHEAFLMTNTNAPAGAQGPGDENTIFDMHVWMQFFNGQGTYDPQGNSYGFDLNKNGTTIGADRLISDNMIVGFNYTYVRADAHTTNQDSMENETYWLGAYSEWVSENGLYVDAMAAYGRSNYDTVRVETDGIRDYQGTASYRGSELGAYADVGQYYYFKNLALAPYAGLQVLTIHTDDHTEKNANGLSNISVEGQSRTLVESTLGMKGRYRFDTNLGRFQTTGYAEWMHDFVQDDTTTTLSANNLPPVSMSAIKPDSDLLNVGVGLSWICRDYMEIGIGYNGRFSDGYAENTGSLLIDIRF